MTVAKLVASEFDNRRVAYVDNMRLSHTGMVVGQSPDKKWIYIQSDRQGVPDADWHFKVSREILPGILTQ